MMRECSYTLSSEMAPEEISEILKFITLHKPKGTHLEIGTAAGGTLCEILKHYRYTLKLDQPDFIVVDPLKYFDRQYEKICENFQNHSLTLDNIVFEKKKSNEALKEKKFNSLALLIIDSNHKINHFVDDLRYTRFLKKNGLLIIHDYSDKFKGVKMPMDLFLDRYKNYTILSRVKSLLIVQKMNETNGSEVKSLDRILAHIFGLVIQLKTSTIKRLSRYR